VQGCEAPRFHLHGPGAADMSSPCGQTAFTRLVACADGLCSPRSFRAGDNRSFPLQARFLLIIPTRRPTVRYDGPLAGNRRAIAAGCASSRAAAMTAIATSTLLAGYRPRWCFRSGRDLHFHLAAVYGPVLAGKCLSTGVGSSRSMRRSVEREARTPIRPHQAGTARAGDSKECAGRSPPEVNKGTGPGRRGTHRESDLYERFPRTTRWPPLAQGAQAAAPGTSSTKRPGPGH